MFQKSKPRLVEADPAPSQARAVLRAAIAKLAAYEADHAALLAAAAAATDARRAAQQAITNANIALSAAKVAAVDRLVSGGSAPSITARQARATLTDAEDALAAATEAGETLEQRIKASEGHRYFRTKEVDEAAFAVLGEAPAIARLVAELDRLQREVADRGVALAWLVRKGAVSVAAIPADGPYGTPSDPPARIINERFNAPPAYWGKFKSGPDAVPGAVPWMDVFERLKRNADAELPA